MTAIQAAGAAPNGRPVTSETLVETTSTPATITRWLYEVEVPERTRSTNVTAGGARSCRTRWK